MAINGKRPKLEAGMIMLMEDGSQRKIMDVTPGAHGMVTYRARKGRTGRFGKDQELKRSQIWKGVDDVWNIDMGRILARDHTHS